MNGKKAPNQNKELKPGFSPKPAIPRQSLFLADETEPSPSPSPSPSVIMDPESPDPE